MTVMSNFEESVIEKLMLGGRVPYAYPETEIKNAGGIISNRFFGLPYNVISDKELVTGQNQFASVDFGYAFVSALREYERNGKL